MNCDVLAEFDRGVHHDLELGVSLEQSGDIRPSLGRPRRCGRRCIVIEEVWCEQFVACAQITLVEEPPKVPRYCGRWSALVHRCSTRVVLAIDQLSKQLVADPPGLALPEAAARRQVRLVGLLLPTALKHDSFAVVPDQGRPPLQFVLAGWLWRHQQRRWAVIAGITGIALLTVPSCGPPIGTRLALPPG